MVAYLILAFKNPAQVARLATRLASDNSIVFIHVDKKVDIGPFLFLARIPNVQFVRKRHRVVWGGYSITETIVAGMKEILADQEFRHIVLMSGQDYPIRPVQQFEQMLSDHDGYSFMSVEENTPASKWWSRAAERYKNYYLSDHTFRGKRVLHKILRRVLPKRKFLYQNYTLYGGAGSTFCALSRQAAKYIVDFMENNHKARNFAKTTFASDEFWFQTLLMNSDEKDKVINTPLWYMDWDGSSKHPRVLSVFDLKPILASKMFFARKFDICKDEIILDHLDALAKTIRKLVA